jgi:endonuclease-8
VPEGDTIRRAADLLDAALSGRVLTRSEFRVPQLAGRDLAGRAVIGVVPRGKHLLIRIEGELTLHTHLGMEGAWRVFAHGAPWWGGPRWQVRVVLANSERSAVGFRLPVVQLLRTRDEHRVVGHLGPDVLAGDWDLDRVIASLRSSPDTEIGTALLDQRVLAGLGNVYRVEACFLAGVTPWTTVGEVPDLRGLVDRAQRMIAANADRSGRVTTGSQRRGEQYWVYGRAGRPCRRCGTPVRTADQAPRHAPEQARVTMWCPHCQRGPAP